MAGRVIALVAHDAKKDDMAKFALLHTEHIKRLFPGGVIATGTTGGRVADATGLVIERMLSGPLGGDAQIAALVATGKCHAVVFLVDPLSAHPHEPDVLGLVRVCNVHNVPVATNVATAELMMRGFNLNASA